MPSLVDIAPAVEQLTIRGVTVTVVGIGLDAIASILGQSPELRTMMQRGSAGLDPAAMLAAAPGAAYALMAAGMGKVGDEAEIAAARALPISDQIAVIEALIRTSAPDGVLPLVAKLTAMLGDAPGVSGA